MAKLDKSQYTKEEWRKIKEQRRLQKEESKLDKQTLTIKESTPVRTTTAKYTLLCLKHGAKYGPEYVNKLYNMVKRHCTLDFDFVCLTENVNGLDPHIKTLPLPSELQGWWCKPYMYSADLPLNGTILYMDLDVVIANNIDQLFTYKPGKWCTIRDFTRAMRPKWQKYNSSVVRFEAGQLNAVWTGFKHDAKNIQRRLFGDQDWLYEATFRDNPAELYPDEWIRSWKWEIRKSREFAPGGRKGAREFKTIENVEPRKDCCVCVFHGDPNPSHCKDPWVIKNWI